MKLSWDDDLYDEIIEYVLKNKHKLRYDTMNFIGEFSILLEKYVFLALDRQHDILVRQFERETEKMADEIVAAACSVALDRLRRSSDN